MVNAPMLAYLQEEDVLINVDSLLGEPLLECS
jgi:hypothetical protein